MVAVIRTQALTVLQDYLLELPQAQEVMRVVLLAIPVLALT
jgi:hypothetical protein